MMKKTIKIILLLIPLIISVGLSSWIIMYSFEVNPTYEKNVLSDLYKFSTEVAFNGSEQAPHFQDDVDLSELEEISFSYSHQLVNASSSVFTPGLPSEVGEYIVIIEGNGVYKGETLEQVKTKVTLKILPKNIIAKPIDISYTAPLSWNDFYTLLNEKIKFTDENGDDLPSSETPAFQITGMTTGDPNCTYGASDADAKTNIVVGSTYLVKIKMIGNKYALYDSETFYATGEKKFDTNGSTILKYKTVFDGTSYQTIEDVISKTGNLVLAGDSSKTVFTAFTSFNYYKKFENDKLSYTLGSSTSLWITYNGTNTLKAQNTTSNINTALANAKVYSCFYIPENVILDVSGTINVCGTYRINSHIVIDRGVLFNNGIINLSGKLYSYGFTKGNGIINANSNSQIYDFMCFYNYANSGGITMSLNNAKIFPMSAYSIHNISCKTKVAYDSTYYVSYEVEIASISINGNLIIIGTNGLFDLENGYLIKYIEDTTSDFTSDIDVLKTNYIKSNQDATQRDVLDIYGKFEDNIVSIQKSGQGITTGTDYAMPIGFMNISLKIDEDGNTGNGTLSANSYKFFPGSKLTIDDGCSLTIGDASHVVFFDDNIYENYNETSSTGVAGSYSDRISYGLKHVAWYSQTDPNVIIGAHVIVNGTLTCYGYLGGFIDTKSSTGVLDISNNNAKIVVLHTENYTTSTIDKALIAAGTKSSAILYDDGGTNFLAYGYIDDNPYKNFDIGETNSSALYISQEDLSDEPNHYYWTNATGAGTFYLEFYDEDKTTLLAKKTAYDLESENGVFSYEIKGIECIPDKSYFAFNNWYFWDGSILVTDDEGGTKTKNNVVSYNVPQTQSDPSSLTVKLYASWAPVEYSFSYQGYYIDPITSENIILDSSDLTFNNYEDIKFTYNQLLQNNITIPFVAEYLNCEFNGWYLYLNGEMVLIENLFTLDMFKKLPSSSLNENLDNRTGQIVLMCRFTDYQEYTIIFDDGIEEYEDQTSITNLNPNNPVNLPGYSSYNENNEYQTYIIGWRFSVNYTDGDIIYTNKSQPTPYDIINKINEYNLTADELDKITIENNTIKLFATTALKNNKIYYKHNGEIIKTHYYNDGDYVVYAAGTDDDGNALEKARVSSTDFYTDYAFNGWTLSTDTNVPPTVLQVGNKSNKYTGDITFNSSFSESKYCTLTWTKTDNVTLNVTYVYNGNSLDKTYEDAITFDYDSDVTFKFTFAGETKDNPGSWSYKIVVKSSNAEINSGSGSIATSATVKTYTKEAASTHIAVTTTYTSGTNNPCIAAGSLVTLADGTYKKVEDVLPTDLILIFNHETGQVEAGNIMFLETGTEDIYNVIYLEFSDGTIIKVITEHGFFDLDLNKYVYFDEENYMNYIGHKFYKETLKDGKYVREYVTLVDSYIVSEITVSYSITSVYHLNFFVDGFISMPAAINGLFNIFEYDENLQYDQDLMEKDILEYGLYKYEDFSEYVTEDLFNALPSAYLKVSIGKGLITYEGIFELLYRYLDDLIIDNKQPE